MNTPLPRRRFLQTSLVLAAWPGVSIAARAAAAPATRPAQTPDGAGLTTYQLGPQIWVRFNNQVVTCYRAHRSQKYPYCYPLAGPVTGLSVTAETALPWPHHRSLFFGCDRVNGGNYWQEGYEQGQILSDGPRLGAATAKSVEILDACEWRKPGGPVVMRDRRVITVTIESPRLRFLDWRIEWEAVEDVTVAKTNHSLFAARAAGDLAPTGGGQLVNAEGETGEKGTFGKKSAWCDFFGRRPSPAGEVVEGLAILDHPGNPWAPTPWFTRDYGFLSPTPLNFITEPWTLGAGRSVTLRYRVVIHAGDPREAGLDGIYRAWAQA